MLACLRGLIVASWCCRQECLHGRRCNRNRAVKQVSPTYHIPDDPAVMQRNILTLQHKHMNAINVGVAVSCWPTFAGVHRLRATICGMLHDVNS